MRRKRLLSDGSEHEIREFNNTGNENEQLGFLMTNRASDQVEDSQNKRSKQDASISIKKAFEYFTMSSFYEKRCNNELLRDNSDENNLVDKEGSVGDPTTSSIAADKLTSMCGLEYRIWPTKDCNMFLVVKQHRYSRTVVKRLAIYVVKEDRIYCAPNIQNLLLSRLTNVALHIRNAFEALGPYKKAQVSTMEVNETSERQLRTLTGKEAMDVTVVRHCEPLSDKNIDVQTPKILRDIYKRFITQNTSTNSLMNNAATIGKPGHHVQPTTPRT